MKARIASFCQSTMTSTGKVGTRGTSGRVLNLSEGERTEEGAATKPNRLSLSLRREPTLQSCRMTSTQVCVQLIHTHTHTHVYMHI